MNNLNENYLKFAIIFKQSWNDFREKIITNADKKLNFFREEGFLERYNNFFKKSDFRQLATLSKRNFKNYKIGRGVIERSEKLTYERFIPYEQYIKESNRFSPPHCAWLYLAIGKDSSQIQRTARAECRAEQNKNFCFCEFKIEKDLQVIDLTIADKYCTNDMIHQFGTALLNNNKKKISRFLAILFSDEISKLLFEPLRDRNINREVEYAPFHILAKYFISEGYDGIIYRSTVCPGGKNMVLFDKNLAKPVQIVESGC